MDYIDAKLKELIINKARIKLTPEDIQDNSDLINDFGFDSIMILGLVVDAENEFGIKMDEDYMASMTWGVYGVLKYYIKKVKEE